MAETANMSLVFVGRQTIYNSELDAFAYELLFRGSDDNRRASGPNTGLAGADPVGCGSNRDREED